MHRRKHITLDTGNSQGQMKELEHCCDMLCVLVKSEIILNNENPDMSFGKNKFLHSIVSNHLGLSGNLIQ